MIIFFHFMIAFLILCCHPENRLFLKFDKHLKLLYHGLKLIKKKKLYMFSEFWENTISFKQI